MDGTCRAKVTVGQVTIELEGAEQFVREQLDYFKEKWLSKLPQPVVVAGTKDKQAPPKLSFDERPNIEDFVKGMTPSTDVDKAAILAYYLKTYDDVQEVDGELIKSWYTKAGWKPPQKPTQTLDNAMRRKSYFEKGSAAGKYALSETGTYYVERKSGKPSET